MITYISTGLINISLIVCILLTQPISASAENKDEFINYINEFDRKRELASQLLIEAEEELKSGDELTSCATQKEASTYGIEATLALIKAMEVNETTEGIENLESGLKKWKELRDFC